MNIGPDNSVDMKLKAWSTRRTLVIIACIDFIFSLLTSLFTGSAIYFIISLIILVGMYGLHKYKYKLSLFYGVYLLFQIVSRFILLMYIKTTLLMMIFIYFTVIFEIWIFWLLNKFLQCIKSLSKEELELLQSNWYPSVYTVVYY